MATISNGESGSSVRTKLNEIINKVEGVTSIDNDIDIVGTLTSDGLTVDGDAVFTTGDTIRLNTADGSDNGVLAVAGGGGNSDARGAKVRFYGNEHSSLGGVLDLAAGNVSGGHIYNFTGAKLRQKIDYNGDLSLYEDTGTTAKFFWDASAESLGIGTSSQAAGRHLTINNTTAPAQSFQQNGTEKMLQGISGVANGGVTGSVSGDYFARTSGGKMLFSTDDGVTAHATIDSSGNVGIGTSSPDAPLEIEGSGGGVNLSINNVGTSGRQYILQSTSSAASIGGGKFAIYDGDASSHRFVLDSSGNVGIGNTTPSSFTSASAPNLVVGSGSGNSGMTIYSGTTSVGGLAFADGTASGSHYRGLVQYTHSSDAMLFYTSETERMRIDSSGNLLIGGTGTPTSSAGNLVLYNGTAPTGNATDGVILYAEDVSTSSELKVRDEAGNVTTLSPHNFDLIPEGPSEDMAWSYYSERDGKRINVDMLKAIRLLEQISGEKLVHMV